MPSSQVPLTKIFPRKHSKDIVDTVENLDIKRLIDPTRKATKIRVRNRKLSKRKSNMAKGTPKAKDITEVDNLQWLYPLKDEWIISCSLETRLVDQMKSLTTAVEMVKKM